jgi:hypothetical protein
MSDQEIVSKNLVNSVTCQDWIKLPLATWDIGLFVSFHVIAFVSGLYVSLTEDETRETADA